MAGTGFARHNGSIELRAAPCVRKRLEFESRAQQADHTILEEFRLAAINTRLQKGESIVIAVIILAFVWLTSQETSQIIAMPNEIFRLFWHN